MRERRCSQISSCIEAGANQSGVTPSGLTVICREGLPYLVIAYPADARMLTQAARQCEKAAAWGPAEQGWRPPSAHRTLVVCRGTLVKFNRLRRLLDSLVFVAEKPDDATTVTLKRGVKVFITGYSRRLRCLRRRLRLLARAVLPG